MSGSDDGRPWRSWWRAGGARSDGRGSFLMLLVGRCDSDGRGSVEVMAAVVWVVAGVRVVAGCCAFGCGSLLICRRFTLASLWTSGGCAVGVVVAGGSLQGVAGLCSVVDGVMGGGGVPMGYGLCAASMGYGICAGWLRWVTGTAGAAMVLWLELHSKITVNVTVDVTGVCSP
jgi:hypothetical protein